jgi:hypothetical protein
MERYVRRGEEYFENKEMIIKDQNKFEKESRFKEKDKGLPNNIMNEIKEKKDEMLIKKPLRKLKTMVKVNKVKIHYL